MKTKQSIEHRAGICGIYCGSCPNYLAFRNGDVEMIKQLAQDKGFPGDAMRCDGCLSNRVSLHCAGCRHGFRACAEDHGVTWCFECADFPCQRLEDFRDVHIIDGISHHATVVEELSDMKTTGVVNWVKKNDAESRCPECDASNYWFARKCSVCSRSIR